jgi:hypothetical protein
LLLKFVRVLLSVIGDKRYKGAYKGQLAEFVKKRYIPLDETFSIINEYYTTNQQRGKHSTSSKDREVTEALAILCKK